MRADVSRQTSPFAVLNFSIALTVENSDGTWMVADIDLIPQSSGETPLIPADGPHS